MHVTIPTTAPEVQALTPHDVIVVGIFLVIFFAISIAIGLFWNKDWWKLALAFWVPFTIFYTSIFTNSDGFFTGTVGSLGYWIAQQAVQRGSQPWYYYILIQIPIYEFLPFLGSILALIIGLRYRQIQTCKDNSLEEDLSVKRWRTTKSENFTNMFALFVWWIVVSIIAFSYAGEKMPWLTIHLAWPMILVHRLGTRLSD